VARADADVVIKLDVRDGEANASLTAFEARLKRLERSGRSLGDSFDNTTSKIDEMSDALGNFESNVESLDKKSLRSLDKELVQKRKDFDALRKTVDKSSKGLDKAGRSADRVGDKMRKGGKDGSAFGQMLKGMWRFAKIAGIEFLALSASVGALNLALKSGQLVAKGWQYVLKGIGVAAGSAVAALSTVLAAVREYQFAMMMPSFKAVGTPMTGATDARSRMSGFMGASKGMGVFSDQAMQQSMSAAMSNGQKVNPQLFAMMRTLGNFTVGTDMEKTLPAVVQAITAAQKAGGKITEDIYSEIASNTPGLAKVFEEMAGGPKALETALEKGTLTVDQFFKAFQDGTLDSIKPFIGALDEVNKTLFGRFKNNIKQVREQLISMGAPLVESLKNPLEALTLQIKVFLTRITAVVQETFSSLIPDDGGGLMSRMFRGLARLINENLPKIKTFASDIRRALNWSKNLFKDIGDYIRETTTNAGGLWDNIFKPLGTEVLKTVDYAIRTFNDLIGDSEPYAENFKGYIEQIGEGVRRLIDGMNQIKKALAPIIDTFLRLLQVISQIMNLGGGMGSVFSTALAGGAFAMMLGKGSKGKAGGAGIMSRTMYGAARIGSLGLIGGPPGKQGGGDGTKGPGLRAGMAAASASGYATSMNQQMAAARLARFNAIQTEMYRAVDAKGMMYSNSYGGFVPQGVPRAFSVDPTHANVIDGKTAQKMQIAKNAMGEYEYNDGSGKRHVIGDNKAFMDKYGVSRQAALGAVGGFTGQQGMYAASGGMMPRSQYLAQARREADRQARRAGRAQGREFLKTSAKQFGLQAGGIAAGIGLSALGGYLSSKTDRANVAGQTAAGAVSGAGQGAMIGAMFGPQGALIGGAIGGVAGGVAGFFGAKNEQKKRLEEARERARELGTSLLVRNDRESIRTQIEANNQNAANYSQPNLDKLREEKGRTDNLIQAMFGNNGEGGINLFGMNAFDTNRVDNDRVRELYRETGMRFKSFRYGTDNILEGDAAGKVQKLIDSGKVSGEELKTAERWMELHTKIKEVTDNAGKSEKERIEFLKETDKLNQELEESGLRFDRNLDTLKTTMGYSAEEAIKFAETMNIDLRESFVTMDTVLAGLGYTTDEFANRATAAGRLLENLLRAPSARRQQIESDTALDATGQRLFNTNPGGFESRNDANLAAVDFAEALVTDLTVARTTKGTREYNMKAEDYAKEVERRMEGFLVEAFAKGIDPTAFRELETLFYGDGGFGGNRFDTTDAAGRRAKQEWKPGGMVGEARDSYQTLQGKLATDEKFALNIGQTIKEAAATAIESYNKDKGAGKDVKVTDYLQTAMDAVTKSDVFKNSGLDPEASRKALEGLMVGEIQTGASAMETAFKRGASDLAARLGRTILGVRGAVTGTVNVNPGGDTAAVKFNFQGSSSGGGGGGTQFNKVGDTRTSRYQRTMSAHGKYNSMLPGSRTVLSGIRDSNLGSPSSDHKFGRAFDLTGDNLGQYAKLVNAEGGFAEFHGAGGERHLHVVPPVGGDTANPAMVGGGGSVQNYYNVSVSAGTDASPDQIAQTVIREIRRMERSDRERR
jgi:hypothetical protein